MLLAKSLLLAASWFIARWLSLGTSYAYPGRHVAPAGDIIVGIDNCRWVSSVRKQACPSYLLEVHTSQGGEASQCLLEADYATLRDICQQLEAALAELKTPATRKLMRGLA
eukprot:jgi/Mesvir1/28469/Mv15890-RA.1